MLAGRLGARPDPSNTIFPYRTWVMASTDSVMFVLRAATIGDVLPDWNDEGSHPYRTSIITALDLHQDVQIQVFELL